MATKIIIDGYNFLWQDALFRDEAIRGHDKGRSAVLKWVSENPQLAAFEVSVVFDAYKTDAQHPSEENYKGVRVIYTAHGQSADDLIREMAAMHGPAAVVVSSDREVMRYAEKKDCGVLGAREFQRALLHPEEFELDPSRKLSKPKRRAISKLLRTVSEGD